MMLAPLILLAAGQSRRMKANKALLNYQGHPWVAEQLKRFEQCGGRRVYLVTGDNASTMQAVVEAFKNILFSDLEIYYAINKQNTGIFSSLQCGIKRMPLIQNCFVGLIDTPLPKASVFWALQAAMQGPVKACVPYYRRRGGHPVYLSQHFLESLKSYDLTLPDARLDYQLKRLDSQSISRVKVSDGSIQINLNTPQDWQSYVST